MNRFVLLRLAFGMLLAFACGVELRAQPAPARTAEEWLHPALAAADWDALALDWLADVAADPTAPEVEALLRGVDANRAGMADPRRLRAPLTALSADARLTGLSRLLVLRMLLDELEEAGEWTDAANRRAELGMVRDWRVIGPFGITNRSCFQEVFPPELNPLDLALSPAGETLAPAWRAAPPPTLDRKTDPFEWIYPRQGAAYALAQCRAAAAGEAILTVQTAGAFRLWWNDMPALELDPFQTDPAIAASVRVPVRAGWNRILVKVVAGSISAFELYLTDASGRPAAVELAPASTDLHPVAPADGASSSPVAHAWPVSQVLARAEEPTGTARELALSALYARWTGQADEALFRIRAAVARAPEDAALRYLAAEIHREAEHYPETYTRNRAQEHYRKCVALDPAFAPAWFGLATLLESDHKIEEARDALHQALKAHPSCFTARLLLLQLYRARGWTLQAEAEAQQLEALAPGSAQGLEHQLDRARDDRNYRTALQVAERWNAARTSGIFHHVSALEDLGEKAKALELWRQVVARSPDEPLVLRRLAAMEEAAGHPDAAEQSLQRVLQWNPLHAGVWRDLGDLRLRSGRRDVALQALRRAAEIDPSDAGLRRELAWFDAHGAGDAPVGDPDVFWAPYQVDVMALIPSAPKRADLPNSSVTYLLDQAVVRIHPDGSSTEYIHQAVKILNERGVDKYDAVEIQGEILHARTITQDGQVLEPVVIPRERELTMPRVTDGVVIDYAFRRHSRERSAGRFSYPNFYFQDPSFDGAFMVSEFIVLVPKGFPFRFAETNMTRKGVITDRGDWLEYRWRYENSPNIEAEPHMPHLRTLLPHVSIGEEQSWREVWSVLREAYLARCMPTRELQEFAARVCAGKTGVRERAEALYYAVMDHVRESNGFPPAQMAFSERTGNRLLLLKTLLDTVGIPADFVATRPAAIHEPLPPWELPRTDLFDGVTPEGMLLRVELGDRTFVWLSGAGRFLTFGEFPANRRDGLGLVLGDAGPEWVHLPGADFGVHRTAAERVLGQVIDVHIRASLEGPAELTFQACTPGPEASFWKERFAEVDAGRRRKFLETIYNPTWPGLVVTALDFPDLESPRSPFQAHFTLRVPAFTGGAGERRWCGMGVIPLKLERAFVADSKRRLPLQLSEAFGSRVVATVSLPERTRCVRLPESLSLQTAFGSYTLEVARSLDGRAVTVRRDYCFPPQSVSPRDYPSFIEFCRSIDRAEAQRIGLESIR